MALEQAAGLCDQGADTLANRKGRGGCDALLVNFRLSPATADVRV